MSIRGTGKVAVHRNRAAQTLFSVAQPQVLLSGECVCCSARHADGLCTRPAFEMFFQFIDFTFVSFENGWAI